MQSVSDDDVQKKNFLKSHILNWWQKVYSDWEDVTSSGRAFQVYLRLIAWPVAPDHQKTIGACRTKRPSARKTAYWHERSKIWRCINFHKELWMSVTRGNDKWHQGVYTVSQKREPDAIDCNFEKD